MNSLEKITSGIEGFDTISLGGIPKNRMTLISGTPGSGKTIFCCQFLVGGIISAKEPAVFVTFEEPPEDIIINVKTFGWNIDHYLDSRLWKFVDISPRTNEENFIRGEYDLSGLIVRVKTAVEQISAKRIVLDSINALFNLYPQPEIIRQEIIRLKTLLNSLSVTSLITSEQYQELGTTDTHFTILDFLSDNVILLKNAMFEEYRRRTVEIMKYRGTTHKRGQHSFTIKSNKGITVISFDRDPNKQNLKRNRRSTGMEGIDKIIGGGFFTGSSILLSGQTGTGKTLLILSMLNGALQKGEKCLMFNFEESREQILIKAKKWNIDLLEAEEKGQFKIISIYPESEGIEDLIVDMKSTIFSFKPDRVFLDSISALERISTRLTFRESLINLILLAREENTIIMLTTTAPTFSGPFLDTEKHISTLSDAIILLRYFEREGKIMRGLAIMKMRDSDHAKQFFEFTIDDEGINVRNPIQGNSGIFDSFNIKKI